MLEEFDFCIKKFLCDFENLECNLRKTTDKPKFVSCYNLCGLENLVETMWILGPIRNFWGGGVRGEGYLRFGQPLITMGRRKNWHVNFLNLMNPKKGLANVMDDEESLEDDEEGKSNKWR